MEVGAGVVSGEGCRGEGNEGLEVGKDWAAGDHRRVCRYFQYGFCKFRDGCRYEHRSECCDRKGCNGRKCLWRHPRPCRYLRKNGWCKFEENCAYSHEEKHGRKQRTSDKCGGRCGERECGGSNTIKELEETIDLLIDEKEVREKQFEDMKSLKEKRYTININMGRNLESLMGECKNERRFV